MMSDDQSGITITWLNAISRSSWLLWRIVVPIFDQSQSITLFSIWQLKSAPNSQPEFVWQIYVYQRAELTIVMTESNIKPEYFVNNDMIDAEFNFVLTFQNPLQCQFIDESNLFNRLRTIRAITPHEVLFSFQTTFQLISIRYWNAYCRHYLNSK